LLTAMLEVPRERFLPPARAALAYLDLDVSVGSGGGRRCMLKPMVLAKLLQAAEIGATDRVLDVGAATGYSAALRAWLAGSVVAREQDEARAQQPREALTALGASHIEVVLGPLAQGWPAGAPYDVILLNGATEVAPRALLGQLKDGGRLLGIEGNAPGK